MSATSKRFLLPALVLVLAMLPALLGLWVTGAGAENGCYPGESFHLEFTTQPHNAETNEVITGTDFATNGDPVEVTVVDDCPSVDSEGGASIAQFDSITVSIKEGTGTSGANLGGTTNQPLDSETDSATFDDLTIDTPGLDYQLHAVAESDASETPTVTQEGTQGDSDPFDIVDQAQSCDAGEQCTATLTDPGVMTVKVVATSSSDGFILLSFDPEPLTCSDSFNHAPHVVLLNTQGFTSATNKVVTITIDKSVVTATPNNGLANYQVCFESDTAFIDRFGDVTTKGLLPDCGKPANPPCISKKQKKGGAVVITLLLRPGDPSFR